MPLSDDETLFRTFQAAKNAHLHTVTEPTEVQLFDATLAGLRAVEAAVRADQIERLNLDAHFECDCVPELGPPHCHGCDEAFGQVSTWGDRDCAAAIRAQQNGDNSE